MTIHEALQNFAQAVTAKMNQLTPGEPEDQLRGPFENLMVEVARSLGWSVICTGETPLPGRLGRPDYGVHLNNLLAGFVELKAPGAGANVKRFTGHNRSQWRRFSGVPNMLYTDGNEWALYRNGELIGNIVRLSGDVAADGKRAAAPQDAQAIERLLREFLTWEPFIPTDRQGKIDLKGFAKQLAPLCRMLREDVADALEDQASPLIQLAKDWRQLLFPDASNEQFADAYAQTVAFALLLGRSEGADPLSLKSSEAALAAQHNMLSRALQVLTDPGARAEMAASLDLLLRVIDRVPPASLAGPEDPWLYFYEDFLAVYDPKLRKEAGAYYTPVEVVRAQVRLIDDLLVNRLGKPLGFADPGVVTLDPAAGTGTYLLGVIQHALGRVEDEQGAGAVPGQASALAANLYGFELMVGPYAVAELRVSRALRDRGAALPQDGTHVYLTDTLESPHAEPPDAMLYFRPIAEQHAKALRVKSEVPVIVCLGNPPYDRHEAVDTEDEDNLSRYGGWVRFGDPLDTKKENGAKFKKLETTRARLSARERISILNNFVQPAVDAGHGIHVKNLYNLYVYFWRWALWKVFEQKAGTIAASKGSEGRNGAGFQPEDHEQDAHATSTGRPGVVSFISASSYLDGDAFCGMREHMRRLCDEIWILDIGGEGRGTRRSDNVFDIQTPVAIAVAVRDDEGFLPMNNGQDGRATSRTPARIHYTRIEGTRQAKYAALDAIDGFASVMWQDCPEDWQAPFRPAGKGLYFDWPLLTDLMPWQHSGVKAGRTWVISPEEETLKKSWRALLNAEKNERHKLFKNSPTGRKGHQTAMQLPPSSDELEAITKLAKSDKPPSIVRYAYRSFDRQFIFADARLLDRPGPGLWRSHGERQVYLTSLINHPLGQGPASTACALLPDLHHFRGSFGAKETFPLYRDADASKANILPGLLDSLDVAYKRQVTPEDFLAYVYGALAQPAFTSRYAKELETRELRVPITKDAALFEKVRDTGVRLLWLHTYGERFVPEGQKRGHVPPGAARCVKAVPGDPGGYPESFEYNDATQTLHVGDGEFRPVSVEVFEFEVSGLKVVQSWLKYRMKKGAGKKSSPLDDIRPECWTSQFTTELLELLWVLEATVAGYPEQAKLLDAVFAGPCFQADELPPVPEHARKPPSRTPLLDEIKDD